MKKSDESCPKLDEIMQLISNEIWKRTNLSLIKKIQDCNLEVEITGVQSIVEFCKELKDFAKQHSLRYEEKVYACIGTHITLEPYSIHISIYHNNGKNNNIGDSCVSAPPNFSRKFSYKNYKAGILWIKNYLEIYPKTIEQIQSVYDTYFLSQKNAEIVNNTILTLCNSICGRKYWDYQLKQDRIMSKILISKSEDTNEVYEILVYNKGFADNPSILVELLNNLRETKVRYVLKCEQKEKSSYPMNLSYFGIFLDYFDGNVFSD